MLLDGGPARASDRGGTLPDTKATTRFELVYEALQASA